MRSHDEWIPQSLCALRRGKSSLSSVQLAPVKRIIPIASRKVDLLALYAVPRKVRKQVSFIRSSGTLSSRQLLIVGFVVQYSCTGDSKERSDEREPHGICKSLEMDLFELILPDEDDIYILSGSTVYDTAYQEVGLAKRNDLASLPIMASHGTPELGMWRDRRPR